MAPQCSHPFVVEGLHPPHLGTGLLARRKLALLEMFLSQKVPTEEYEAHTVQFACEDAIDDAPIEGVSRLIEQKVATGLLAA